MWLKKHKTNALLAPLAEVVEGEVSDGRLTGSYRDYAVEARAHTGYPIKYTTPLEGGTRPAEVNMLAVSLAGVPGSRTWHCQSSAHGAVHDLASRFTAGPLLERFKPGQFKFEGADPLNESMERMGEKLVRRLGMSLSANADPALQERLVGAGLFDELDALRWGGHPFLPKVQFMPGALELVAQVYGDSPYRSMIEAKAREAEAETPGRLMLEVEAGEDRVPSPERFRELLEHALRIAQINARVNAPR